MNMTTVLEARTGKPLTGCTNQEIYLALLDLVREQQLKDLEAHLAAAAELAKSCGVSREELHEMLRILLEEEER